MERYEIKSLFSTQLTDGEQITVSGWVRTSRESKNIAFLEVNDGSCFKNLQVIIEASKLESENYKSVANAPVGSSVIVSGVLVLTPEAKQPFELNARTVEIAGGVDSPVPSSACKNQYFRRCFQNKKRECIRHS